MSLQVIFPTLKRNTSILRQFIRLQTRTAKTEAKSELSDEPIKYSTSKAAEWKAKYSSSGEDYFKRPKIQAPVVWLSLVSFMVYFCILREENDLDEWLRNLEKQGPLHFEETQLRVQIEQLKKAGKDTRALELRMNEVKKLIQSM